MTHEFTATYSPDDNKLRIYAANRLPPELYQRVRGAGFIWAPKQGLFVAPAWTPERADLCIELAGEIEDEDKSLVDRASERAERFEDYSDKRAHDAERARQAVAAIADNIPLGQPILVGHHSERHARKDAERIENGMRNAVRLWDTSQYWIRRAEGAIRSANYKERPDVRARRIKGIEADIRKIERVNKEADAVLARWALVDQPEKWPARKDGSTLTREERAEHIAGMSHGGYVNRTSDGQTWTAYDVLRLPAEARYKDAPLMSIDEVLAAVKRAHDREIPRRQRWLEHYQNRLAYERAMLGQQGGTVADQTGPEKGGACRCWASPRAGWSWIVKVNKVSVTVYDNWGYGGGNFTRTIPFDKLREVMTRAQVEEASAAGLLVETADGVGFGLLTEAPKAPKPEPAKPQATDFEALREAAKAGVQVVAVPQLFPTPPTLAARMAAAAALRPGGWVLEPSAGTGALVEAVRALEPSSVVVAVEQNLDLANQLASRYKGTVVMPGDFLSKTPFELQAPFDSIVMNPPFKDAEDIRHIKHAIDLLKTGGRLVAICANGPRQNAQLRPFIEEQGGAWEELPAGSFAESGTNVHAALITFTKGAQ